MTYLIQSLRSLELLKYYAWVKKLNVEHVMNYNSTYRLSAN